MQSIYWIGCTVVLLILSIQDLKYRNISVIWLIIFAIINLIPLMDEPFPLTNIIISSIAFILLTILSVCSKKQFGMGDVWVISALLLGMGIRPVFQIVLFASICVLLWAFIQYLSKRNKTKNFGMPFVPFIFCSFAVMNIIIEIGL